MHDPGPDRDRRKADGDPLLRVPISSELGNVSPVAILPFDYSDDELWFIARNVATMVANNGSFNCNAAKLLITARDWPQRAAFLDAVREVLRGLAISRFATVLGISLRSGLSIIDAIEIFVHEDWERTRSNSAPRAAQAASSGEVSRSKP